MKFNFGASEEIDFDQSFLNCYSKRPDFKLNRFNVYNQYTSNLFPSESVDYFLIIDKKAPSKDSAMFGIKWKNRQSQEMQETKLKVLNGDEEVLLYIAKALIPLIKERERKRQEQPEIPTSGYEDSETWSL